MALETVLRELIGGGGEGRKGKKKKERRDQDCSALPKKRGGRGTTM